MAVEIENLEHDVNLELSKFHDSFECVVHKEDSPRALRSGRGCDVESSSHM
jgi:hypothetical protein